MRLVALTVLLIGNLLANQVLAENVSPQPLTRADCGNAGMAWDDNANVCGAASLAAKPVPEAEGAQPVNSLPALSLLMNLGELGSLMSHTETLPCSMVASMLSSSPT